MLGCKGVFFVCFFKRNIFLCCHLQNKTAYVDIIHKYLDIHGTVDNGASIPAYVTNHGIVKGAEVHALLRESKVSPRSISFTFSRSLSYMF